MKYSGFDKTEDELIKCNFANYPDCDILIIYDKKEKNERAISSFTALCRKDYENGYTYDKCEIAKIIAGTKLKSSE